jgi:hypothetical protein
VVVLELGSPRVVVVTPVRADVVVVVDDRTDDVDVDVEVLVEGAVDVVVGAGTVEVVVVVEKGTTTPDWSCVTFGAGGNRRKSAPRPIKATVSSTVDRLTPTEGWTGERRNPAGPFCVGASTGAARLRIGRGEPCRAACSPEPVPSVPPGPRVPPVPSDPSVPVTACPLWRCRPWAAT